jgi:hypothetical protein
MKEGVIGPLFSHELTITSNVFLDIQHNYNPQLTRWAPQEMQVLRQCKVPRAKVRFVTIQRENIRPSKKQMNKAVTMLPNCPTFSIRLWITMSHYRWPIGRLHPAWINSWSVDSILHLKLKTIVAPLSKITFHLNILVAQFVKAWLCIFGAHGPRYKDQFHCHLRFPT